MSQKKPYYISTAIAYTSAKPHIGNTYEIVLADAIARYKRQAGFDVSLQKLPFNEYEYAVKNGHYDLYLGEVVLSPGMDLSVFFSENGELSAGVGANRTTADAYFDFVSGTVDFSTFNQDCFG